MNFFLLLSEGGRTRKFSSANEPQNEIRAPVVNDHVRRADDDEVPVRHDAEFALPLNANASSDLEQETEPVLDLGGCETSRVA